MRIALVQMSMEDSEEENLKKCLKWLKYAAEQQAELCLFPELTLHRFFPQYKAEDAEEKKIDVTHPWVAAFQEICRENRIFAVPNFYLKENGKAYDVSILIDSHGNIAGMQKMVHIAQAEFFYEQSYYVPSDDGFHVFDTSMGKIGIVVCFDRHYPESIRTEKLKGADLILIPTANTETEPLEMFEWEVRVQAFQNGVPIAMCNRIGKEDAMGFAGKSVVVDVEGNVLARADEKEQVLIAEIDMDRSVQASRKRPYTSLRRTEFYQ